MANSIYTLNINIQSGNNPNKPGKITLSDGTQLTDYTGKQRQQSQIRATSLKSIRTSAVKSYYDKKNESSYKQLKDAESQYKDFISKGGDPKSGKGIEYSGQIKDAKDLYDKTVKANTQAAYNVNQAINVALNTMKQSAQFMLSLPGAKYSDIATQNNINNAMGAAQQLGSVASSIIIGAEMGGWVGAAIAAVGEVASRAINAYGNYEEYQWRQQRHTVDEVRANERLGAVRTNRNR